MGIDISCMVFRFLVWPACLSRGVHHKGSTARHSQAVRDRLDGLLYAWVGIDRYVPGSAPETLILPVGNVEASRVIAECLRSRS